MKAKRKATDKTRNIGIVLILFLAFNAASSCAQTKPCRSVIDVTMDNIVAADEKGNLLKDTLQRKITMIFEQGFKNDSAVIMLGKRALYKTSLKTHQFLGVNERSFDIDYASYDTPPKISIILVGSNQCVSFFPKVGKQLAYINYIQGGWAVELSNLLREYR